VQVVHLVGQALHFCVLAPSPMYLAEHVVHDPAELQTSQLVGQALHCLLVESYEYLSLHVVQSVVLVASTHSLQLLTSHLAQAVEPSIT
jgi:hypothetical protein